MAIGLGDNVEAANIPVAVTTCATCGNQANLKAAAVAYLQTWMYNTPPGYAGVISPPVAVPNGCGQGTDGATILLVVSTSIPISGTFYGCYVPGARGSSHVEAVPLSATTDAQAVSVDNLLIARAAAETGPIKLPPTLPLIGGDEIDLTEQYLTSIGMPLVGTITYSLWHGILTLNFPAVAQGTFLNITTGKTVTVWSGDVITVTDTNGYTAQFQFNPGAPYFWVFVPNSIRDPKGNPIPGSAGTPTTGGVIQPIGPINVGLPGQAPIYISPWLDNPTPGGTVTVGDPIVMPAPVLQCTNPGICTPG